MFGSGFALKNFWFVDKPSFERAVFVAQFQVVLFKTVLIAPLHIHRRIRCLRQQMVAVEGRDFALWHFVVRELFHPTLACFTGASSWGMMGMSQSLQAQGLSAMRFNKRLIGWLLEVRQISRIQRKSLISP